MPDTLTATSRYKLDYGARLGSLMLGWLGYGRKAAS